MIFFQSLMRQSFKLCYNGTHVDAPYHFYEKGKTIDEIALERFVGKAYVSECDGMITAEKANTILYLAKHADMQAAKRILIKGKAVVTKEAAEVFADEEIFLLGNEFQTVGPEDSPEEAHLRLLEKEIVLLEGIRLDAVREGVYFLNAAPMNLGGSDGAPCRAILIELPE